MGSRLGVGHAALDRRAGVRILPPQPPCAVAKVTNFPRLFKVYSSFLPLSCKFESKKLMRALFCSTLELPNNSGALEHRFSKVISVIE